MHMARQAAAAWVAWAEWICNPAFCLKVDGSGLAAQIDRRGLFIVMAPKSAKPIPSLNPADPGPVLILTCPTS